MYLKNNKLVFVCLSIILSMVLVLSGCGRSSDVKESQGTDTSTGTTTTQPDTNDEQITLKILSATIVEKPEGDVEKSISEEFMKQNPNIKIEYIGVPAKDSYAKITAMAIGNEMPDIFYNNFEFQATAHDLGITANLTELLGEDYIKGFQPIAVEQASIDGKMQFIPWFSIPTGLIYRTDWFEEEGLNPPETWDDFLEAAKKLTKDLDGDNKLDRWGFAMMASASGAGRFGTIMQTFGASELYQDENGKWVTDVGSPKSIEAFQFFGDLVTKHNVVPPGALEVDYQGAVNLMAGEKTAMMVTGPHSIGAIIAQNPSLEGKLAGVPVPKKEKHASVLGIVGYSIAESSQHKEAAVKYLKFLLEKENLLKWNAATYRMPTRLDAAADPQITGPTVSGFIKAMDYGYTVANASFYTKVQDAIVNAYQEIITGRSDAETAAKKAEKEINALIEQNQ